MKSHLDRSRYEHCRRSGLGHQGQILLVFVVAASLMIAVGAWLYADGRADRSWGFAGPWAASYGALVRSDGVGYLSWTYAIADGDLCFRRYIDESLLVQPQDASGFHLPTGNGCFMPQYTLGQGLIWFVPVMALRKAQTFADGTPPTSWLATASGAGMLVGSAVSAAVGIAAITAFLRRRIRLAAALIGVVATFVGMYGFHYGTFDAQFSHATSFGLFGLLILLVDRIVRCLPQTTWLATYGALLGALVGMIGLVRLTNLLIAAVYIAIVLRSPLSSELGRGANANAWPRLGRAIAAFALVLLGSLALQVIPWYARTGTPLPHTYVGQGFSLSMGTPEVLVRILADPLWHGAIVWSPISVVAVAGLVIHRRRLGAVATGSLAATACMVLTSATWSFPSGAGGLGLRFLIDVAPFMAVGTAALLGYASSSSRRRVIASTIALCSIWSALIMIAYWNARLPIAGASLPDLVQVALTPRLP